MDYKYDYIMAPQIKLERERRGWTQEKLALKMQLNDCDITRSSLAKIESGQGRIYSYELKMFKNVLEMNFDDLFL